MIDGLAPQVVADPGAETRAAELRAELERLHERRRRGALGERDSERALAEGSVELCRAVIRGRLAPDEPILAEHHVVSAQLRLSRSLLRESDQRAVSLLLTDRRLLRLRATVAPDRPTTCDAHDATVVDELALCELRALHTRRTPRWGEAAAGLTILAVAALVQDWLQVTGPLLLALGALGVLHALALPTRTVELIADGSTFEVLAPWRRSGRRLLRLLRRSLPAAPR
jgi:hypothetical protein